MKGRRGAAALLAAFTLVGAAKAGPDTTTAAAPSPAPAAPTAAAPPPSSGDLERLIARYDAEERSLREEKGRIAPETSVVDKRLLARGRAYYKQVRAGLLPAGGGFDAFVDHAANVERNRRGLYRDLARHEYLARRGGEIDQRIARLRAERAPLDVQREAMVRARAVLQQADERRAAFARAFEGSQRPPDYLAVYGAESGPTNDDAPGGFRALKGRLPFPLAGRAEARRVTVASSGSPALELAASPSAIVRGVAPGRVAFADKHDDYGLTVILDHGDRYFSIYANLGACDVHVGDTLATGGRLGTLGAEGGRATLHFELRHGPEAVDPSGWLGL